MKEREGGKEREGDGGKERERASKRVTARWREISSILVNNYL